MIKRIIYLFLLILIFTNFEFLLSKSNSKPVLHVNKLGPNLYKMSTAINNWLVLVGPEGVLLSDTGPESMSIPILEKLKQMGFQNVKFIINTHWHHDHTGANLLFGQEAIIIAHPSVRDHLSQKQEISLFKETFKAYPTYALPDLTISSSLKIYFNDEEINLISFPGGHTAGDIVVYFKNANVLHLGDLYIAGHFPMIDYDHGGDAISLAANLQEIIKVMPANVKIVSGHLQDGTIKDLKKYREMILKTIDIVRGEMKLGKSLEEMQSDDILKDWKAFGQHVSCDMWIKSIYVSLSKEKENSTP